MSYIRWKIKSQDISLVNKISSKLECGEIVSRILINRGIIDINAASGFLSPNINMLHDPFSLNDMDKAVQRINLAIKKNEMIYIYGDYDVDGITAVSVLYLYLKNFTQNIFYYIPDRFSQGYGINTKAIDKLFACGCDLIISVDTGISASKEIEYAKQLGLDVIVTDHHECQEELPKCNAVVNPKRRDSTYYFSSLAGVGVVYKLICALDYILCSNHHNEYIDLVAIGTIADIMPLVDENRYIVKSGLEKLANNANSGVKHLIDNCVSTPQITSETISFALAPRINASGRLGNAEEAVKLFTTDDDAQAVSIAKYLCDLNIERQQIENEILEQSVEIIKKHDLDKKYNALVIWNEGWHSGVIGIVASKLKDRYNKPVILFSIDEKAKGSGRSVAPFNLYEAFENIKEILIQYGGHKYAAGVVLEKERLHEFRDRLSSFVGQFLEHNSFDNNLEIECELEHRYVNCKTVRQINYLQPYGKSNEVPLFCIRNIRICDVFPTTNNKHLRIKFDLDGKCITGFYFGVTLAEFDYNSNDFVDIVCELNENQYKNIKSVQLVIRDLRYTKPQIDLLKSKRDYCDKADNILKSMLPSRNDIAVVYKSLLTLFSSGRVIFNIDTVYGLVRKNSNSSINYEKVYFSIKILLELGIISGDISGTDLVINNIEKSKKFCLSDSAVLTSIYESAGEKFYG